MGSDSDDLVQFLRARLSEDEESARRACKLASPEWHLDDLGETVLWWPPEPKVAEAERRHGIEVSADVWRGQTIEFGDTDIAQHIARWDPARVLAEVDVKRRQIELCEHMAAWTDEHNPRVSQHEMTSMRIAAEQMLLLLAAPYAEHPECRDEWRP